MIEIVGIVLAVERDNELANKSRESGTDDELDIIFDRFKALGFDVQAVSLHIDGLYRIEVRNS